MIFCFTDFVFESTFTKYIPGLAKAAGVKERFPSPEMLYNFLPSVDQIDKLLDDLDKIFFLHDGRQNHR
jgi:hypothetical protein